MKPELKNRIHIFSDRESMGKKAALDIGKEINSLLKIKPLIRMIFAAAPSQNEMLKYLSEDNSIDWSRIEAFHMDEYIGLNENDEASFARFLKDKLFDKHKFYHVHLIDGKKANEDFTYRNILEEKEIDIVCLGIGENGHIAFNDPPVDFSERPVVRKVELDLVCRQQQVNDGCFPDLKDVPTHAYTITIPFLISPLKMFCTVPGKSKAEAIYHTFRGEISENWPSSILRNHNGCNFYLDNEAASKL